ATKSYSPRLVSGRILADAVCVLPDGSALLTIQQQKIRQGAKEVILKQTLTVIDSNHIIAVEFLDTTHLAAFDLNPPTLRAGSHPGTILRSTLNSEHRHKRAGRTILATGKSARSYRLQRITRPRYAPYPIVSWQK